MEDAHARSVEEVASALGASLEVGLSSSAASRLLVQHGRNELAPEPPTPLWKLVLKQFDDLLVKILIAAALVDCVISIINGEGAGGFVEPGVIVLILIANATVGVVTESRAEAAIDALRSFEAARATVLRDGSWSTVPASLLVPGDVVEVAAGSRVPADLRVAQVFSSRLRVDQSILTGESAAVSKDAEAVRRAPDGAAALYQDKTNVLFSGTAVEAGRCRGIVVATGAATAMGAIRDALAEGEPEPTPLQRKLDELGEALSKMIAGICALVWIVSIPRFSDPIFGGWMRGALYSFKTAVALAVAAIPEGLPAVVTTCLALGTREMARRNAIVRRLPSVETLGCTTVICSDKTGTLTTNKMVAAEILTLADDGDAHAVAGWPDPRAPAGAGAAPPRRGAVPLLPYAVSGVSFDPEGTVTPLSEPLGGRGRDAKPADASAALRVAAAVAAACNESHLRVLPGKAGTEQTGEATELALRTLAEKLGGPGRPGAAGGAAAQAYVSNRGTPANDLWTASLRPFRSLEFTRDRKRSSVLCGPAHGRAGETTSAHLTGPAAAVRDPPSPPAPLDRAQRLLLVKGAPDSVIPRCVEALLPSGARRALDADARAALLRAASAAGGERALRVLALAYKEVSVADRDRAGARGGARDPDEVTASISPADEDGLVLAALVGIRDPPRPEAGPAVRACHDAGIRVIMATGDDPATARSVARAVGLLDGGRRSSSALGSAAGDVGVEDEDEDDTADGPDAAAAAAAGGPLVLTGREFEALSDAEALRAVSTLRVLARVEPAHKTRLVDLLKRRGEIVAMTGDGVNDAPALRRADIGVAMGSGTAVARGASDLVLADDDFATVVAAVECGRGIFDNARAFIRYMISSNVGEVVAILSGVLAGLPEILSPVQLLWVNLVTDGLPATALSLNPTDPDAMRRGPRDPSEGVVDAAMVARYAIVGAYVGLATLSGFVWGFVADPDGPLLPLAGLRLGCLPDGMTLDEFVTKSGPKAVQRILDGAGVAASQAGANATALLLHSGRAPPPCEALETRAPATVAVTVLVVVEMFNALNALSEARSLFETGIVRNPFLLAAIALSLLLHAVILYVPTFQAIFDVAPLSLRAWGAVLVLSAPVILVEEVLKVRARKANAERVRRTRAGLWRGKAEPRGPAAAAPGTRDDADADEAHALLKASPAEIASAPSFSAPRTDLQTRAGLALRSAVLRVFGSTAASYVPLPPRRAELSPMSSESGLAHVPQR